jgi:hypothetical protein
MPQWENFQAYSFNDATIRCGDPAPIRQYRTVTSLDLSY